MTINAQEAAAFTLSCKLRGLGTQESLAELARTEWLTPHEDRHWNDRRRHTPTIRRLAKPLVLKLDAEAAAMAASEAQRAAEIAAWCVLPDSEKQELRAAVNDARAYTGGHNGRQARNQAVRATAAAAGYAWHARNINTLAAFVAR